jgi:hypothetical protein
MIAPAQRLKLQPLRQGQLLYVLHLQERDPVAARYQFSPERAERMNVARDGRSYDSEMHLPEPAPLF